VNVAFSFHCRIPVMDNYTDSISDSFEKAFDFIGKQSFSLSKKL